MPNASGPSGNVETRDLYAIKYRPARANLLETITAAEGAVIERHFHYLKDLHDKGQAKLIGRCENGAYGLALMWADSPATAAAMMKSDPAVKEGVFLGEVELFRVVLETR